MVSANGRSKRWARILHTLAVDGPLNPYKTWTKLAKDEIATQPTIRGDLEKLVEEGLVKTVDTNLKARGGRPSRCYDLSVRGLVALMGGILGDAITSSRMTQLAEKYHDLIPDLFSLWPHIVRTGIERLALERLKGACCLYYYDALWKDPAVLDDELAEFVEDFLLFGEQNERRQWMESLSKNDALRYVVVRMNTRKAVRTIEKLTADFKLMPARRIELTPELRSEITDLGRGLQRLTDAARRVCGIAQEANQSE